MKYIQCPNSIHGNQTDVRLFLAGGITGCPNWQDRAVEKFSTLPDEATIYNPRRTSFDVNDPNATEFQIKWEFEALHNSTDILFWFPCETLCPITLYEYGRYLTKYSYVNIFVGAHPEYKRLEDLKIQTQLATNGLVYIIQDFETLLKETYSSLLADVTFEKYRRFV